MAPLARRARTPAAAWGRWNEPSPLSFIALAITMFYGAGFALVDSPPRAYSALGGVLVALAWVAVGFFGKDDDEQPATETRPQDTR